MWEHTGEKRPAFAEQPSADQESVWDYPRPPILVISDERVEVSDAYIPIATSLSTLRVLETASPPTGTDKLTRGHGPSRHNSALGADNRVASFHFRFVYWVQ